MTTRKRTRKRNLKKDKQLVVEELHRSDALLYTNVYYDVSDGDPDDPASQTDRRVAVFNVGLAPKNIGEAVAKQIDDSYSYSYFEGIEEALIDEIVEVTKESDYDAEQYRQEERSLLEPKRHYDYRTGTYIERDGSEYETFLEAIEKVAEDDSDEEAWKVIDNWRARQLRLEERV